MNSIVELFELISGQVFAVMGAAAAMIFAGMGSAKGVGLVGECVSGLITEDPAKGSKATILQLLPGTQGLYGFITAFLIMIKTKLLSNPLPLTTAQGLYFLFAALPIAVVGYQSAIKQGRVAATGINVLAKRPEAMGKAIMSASLVETYAILALLVSVLLILRAPV